MGVLSIKMRIIDYFKNVFVAPEQGNTGIQITSHSVINQSQNEHLTAEVTFEEFTTAMSRMHPDKASRPDGLNPAFY